MEFARPVSGWVAHPLEEVVVAGAPGAVLVVRDGEGRPYQRVPVSIRTSFVVGGALGAQTVEALDRDGRVLENLRFRVDAATAVEDEGGRFHELFEIAGKTIREPGRDGVETIAWRGRSYECFVSWILDHSHVTKGMQYLSPVAGQLVDLFGAAQRSDGLIWSFAFPDGPAHNYHYWAYHGQGYAWADGGIMFGRQPVENHNESNFVDALYYSWKGSGDNEWMAGHLDQARRALDYSVNSPSRWSSRYSLLKRGYTIDSWDFQPTDKYLVPFVMGANQQIDPERTKFVVFFGDNTAYAHACDQLVEMLEQAGRNTAAGVYRERARQIRERIDKLAWNGRFYTHHVEEDPGVVRDYGVDEKSQLAMSNAYSLNRGVTHAQAAAILATYEELRQNLPARSPGEWYAVYPPYGKGFDSDGVRWQYMNGGVHAHAAGELARGAFENGYEKYGADILERLGALGRKHGGKLYFAYTGGYDPPPPGAVFTPLNIAAAAVSDIGAESKPGVPGWMGHRSGDDMRNLPVGRQVFAGVPYAIPDPAQNGRRVAIACSSAREGLPENVSVPVGKKAAAVYLLHVAESVGPSNVAGAVRFQYAGGSSRTVAVIRGKHLSQTWFPGIEGPDAGVAWRGANGLCGDVGVYWAAIANPEPEKEIEKLVFSGSQEGSVYSVAGVTLASRVPYHEAPEVSFGGPDNWSGGLVLYALMEGLAGIRDEASAFRTVRLSPRWTAAGVKNVSITARYPASRGYVGYRFQHDEAEGTIRMLVTGNAARCQLRVLLPEGARAVRKAEVDGQAVVAALERVENSVYAVVAIPLPKPAEVRIVYGK